MKNHTYIRLFTILILSVLISCTGGQKAVESTPDGSTTAQEPEWISLFDGQTLEGWKRYNADEIGPLWSVENGVIKCDGEGLGEGSGEMGGSLVTIATFSNFELELEWKISEGGNSGIMYHVVERPEYSHAYHTGPEYQVLDDAGWQGWMETMHKSPAPTTTCMPLRPTRN